MTIFSRAAILFAAVAVVAAQAHAATVLTFGQAGQGSPISATENTARTQTTIAGTDVAVTITQTIFDIAPVSAYLTLNLVSDGAAQTIGELLTQNFNGTLAFNAKANGTGTNYLSATFTDTVVGITGGTSLVLTAAEPPGHIAFTSDVAPASVLANPRAISFSFANVAPAAAIDTTTLAAFTGSVAGTISASAVPEPATLALLGASITAVGMIRRRR